MNNLIKALFILLAVLTSTANSFSQTFEWEKVIGNSGVTEKCDAAAKIHPNLYVFGGYFYPNASGAPRYAHLVFINSNGDTLYTKTYTQFHISDIKNITVHTDSSFLVIGSFYDTISGFKAGFLFKSDARGNIIWQKKYPQVYVGNKVKLLAVPDGYLHISQEDLQLTKFDKEGNIIWQRSDTRAGGHDITLLQDGSYLACGFIRDPNSPTNISNYYKTSPYLVQLKPNGDTVRTKTFGSVLDHDLLNAARQTADGGLILAGRYVQNTSGTRMEGLVIKLDSNWNQQWYYTFYPKSGAYDDGSELYNIQEIVDSSFIVSGYYRDDVPGPYGDAAGFVAKLSKNGGLLWQRQYQVNGIGEWFYNMVYNDDGSAIFSGNQRSSSTEVDFYLVKLSGLGLPYKPDYCSTLPAANFTAGLLANDTVRFSDLSVAGTRYGTISTWEWHLGDGTVSTDSVPKHKYNQTVSQLYNTPVTLIVTNNSGCRDSVTLFPFRTIGLQTNLPNVQVQLYPNPAAEQTTITLSGYNQKVELQLLDITGRKVTVPVEQTQLKEKQQLKVNTFALPKGLYLYRLLSDREVIATGKLVKE